MKPFSDGTVNCNDITIKCDRYDNNYDDATIREVVWHSRILLEHGSPAGACQMNQFVNLKIARELFRKFMV